MTNYINPAPAELNYLVKKRRNVRKNHPGNSFNDFVFIDSNVSSPIILI